MTDITHDGGHLTDIANKDREGWKMRRLMLLMLVFWVFNPAPAGGEEFLGAQVIPGGKTIQKTDARMAYKTHLSHDKAVIFYREALKAFKDIKFRNWKNDTYIEDDGKLAWHSITISKRDEKGATVTIVKDNWTWIIGTLLLRYIGVFVVLMVLFLGMSVSGKIISRSIEKMEASKQKEKGQ